MIEFDQEWEVLQNYLVLRHHWNGNAFYRSQIEMQNIHVPPDDVPFLKQQYGSLLPLRFYMEWQKLKTLIPSLCKILQKRLGLFYMRVQSDSRHKFTFQECFYEGKVNEF